MPSDPSRNTQEWVCRQAILEEIIGLRDRIIITGTDRTTPYFDGDAHPDTRHYGLFVNDRICCCASIMRSAWQDQEAWQLRGMASDLNCQGQGMGAMLLRFIEADLYQSSDIKLCWCNARSGAAAFYAKMGWRTVSDEFMIAGVGPHYRMVKDLSVLKEDIG